MPTLGSEEQPVRLPVAIGSDLVHLTAQVAADTPVIATSRIAAVTEAASCVGELVEERPHRLSTGLGGVEPPSPLPLRPAGLGRTHAGRGAGENTSSRRSPAWRCWSLTMWV